MRIVSANVTARRPGPAGSSRTGAVFEIAVYPSGTTRVMPKTALNAGSSQHGNARRASTASNWLTAMTCVRPSASLKVLR